MCKAKALAMNLFFFIDKKLLLVDFSIYGLNYIPGILS